MVLLSRNSRVDAYRNEQLLGSFYLNSGSQFIDTSSFPPGSYSVALKVYENNQLTRTELVPFTKTGGLTDGNAQWFLQAGKTTSQLLMMKVQLINWGYACHYIRNMSSTQGWRMPIM